MELLIGICNISDTCSQKSVCYHGKLHEYMTAICRNQYCHISGQICRCDDKVM